MKIILLRDVKDVCLLTEESSYNDLVTNITTSFPNTSKRQHAVGEVSVAKMLLTPVRTTSQGGAIRVNSLTRSNGNVHKQVVMLSDVQFQPSETDSNVAFNSSSDGTEYYVLPVPLQNARVRVNCDCLDFHHRFAVWNFDDESLFGKKPPPYQRKTDTRPPVNPDQVPGVCKHLMKVFQQLQQSGLLSG